MLWGRNEIFILSLRKLKAGEMWKRSFYLEIPKNMKIVTDNRKLEENRLVDKVPRKKQWD